MITINAKIWFYQGRSATAIIFIIEFTVATNMLERAKPVMLINIYFFVTDQICTKKETNSVYQP